MLKGAFLKKYKAEKSFGKARQAKRKPRKGYSTVARSRGIYGQGEMKYFDTERSITSLTASTNWTATEFPPNVGTPNTILCPDQGTAINQRIGREVNVYKIKVRGLITVGAQTGQNAGDNYSMCRVALVMDTQTNAAQAQGEDIFAAPVTASAIQAVSSFQSLANTGRFRVLKDKWILLEDPNIANDTGATGGIVASGIARRFNFSHRFKKPIRVRFNAANGGTIADIVDNSWAIYANTTFTTLTPQITYQARVSYKE